MNKQTIDNAARSGARFSRKLDRFEVAERNLDVNYEWHVVDRKIRMGKRLQPSEEAR